MPRLLQPLSAIDLAAKLQQLIGDGRLREQLRESGYVRVESMTWQSHVARLLELYRFMAPREESKVMKRPAGASRLPNPS